MSRRPAAGWRTSTYSYVYLLDADHRGAVGSAHQRALGDQGLADAAGDGRFLAGQFQVQLAAAAALAGPERGPLHEHKLRVAVVQIIDAAAFPIAQLMQQTPHRRIRFIRGREQLVVRALRFQRQHQRAGDAVISGGFRHHQQRDEALLKKGSIQNTVAQYLLGFGQPAAVRGDRVVQRLTAAEGPARDGVDVDQGRQVRRLRGSYCERGWHGLGLRNDSALNLALRCRTGNLASAKRDAKKPRHLPDAAF